MRLLHAIGSSFLAVVSILLFAGCDDPGVPRLHLHRHHQVLADTEEPGGPIEKAQPLATVIDRVNQNSQNVDFMIRGGGVTARGEYMERRHPESYELRGTLLYRKPRDMYLALQHSLGGKMEIGSNSQEFWVWKRMGKDHYWWGRQNAVDANQEIDIPLRPNDLVEVLGLGELPTDIPKSEFKVDDLRYNIEIPGRSASGRTYVAKTIHIDRREPHLVREMEYIYPDGVKRVVARLSRYEAIEGSSVMAPRRIQIEWPERGGNMDLEFATMQRFDSEAAASRFDSPLQRGRDVGIMERVDQPGMASGQ